MKKNACKRSADSGNPRLLQDAKRYKMKDELLPLCVPGRFNSNQKKQSCFGYVRRRRRGFFGRETPPLLVAGELVANFVCVLLLPPFGLDVVWTLDRLTQPSKGVSSRLTPAAHDTPPQTGKKKAVAARFRRRLSGCFCRSHRCSVLLRGIAKKQTGERRGEARLSGASSSGGHSEEGRARASERSVSAV